MVLSAETIKLYVESLWRMTSPCSKQAAMEMVWPALQSLDKDIDTAITAARTAAIKESRSGHVCNNNFDCCEHVLPWVIYTFFNGDDPRTAEGFKNWWLKHRDIPINFCPFCGAKL